MSQQPVEPSRRPSQTKIVATVGPACGGRDQLVELITAGVDVFRINTAHGDREEHQRRLDDVCAAGQEAGRVVAVLVDLAGPKIRLGELPDGQLECVAGEEVRFIRGESPSNRNDLTTTYEPLIDELSEGDRVVLADGTVALVVVEANEDAALCRVVQGGLVRSRQGVNLPGVKLTVPALGEKDRDNAVWAARAGADYVSLSFVRTADEIRQLKALIKSERSDARVIAKMEKPEAIDNLESIVEATDGVMVARGDLGVEIDIAQVPCVQKRIVAMCNRYRKPVIIATQMLDSMQHSRLPTRAEATDVANAILDGADACMLSGETAIGRYPRETVEMMHRIALATESLAGGRSTEPQPAVEGEAVNEITEATTFAAGQLAETVDARTIIVASGSGHTALTVSKHRRRVPVVGVSDSEASLRRMCLYWGVIPLAGAPVDDGGQLLEYVIERGRKAGYFSPGDRVVLVYGTGIPSSRHNMIVVHQIE
ncbi:MAG: pyruvate kinase [Planctomycetota bacterium]|jgi:pyruvate kinase